MKFNIKSVSERPQSNSFPALYKQTPEPTDGPDEELIIWALDRGQGVVIKDSFEEGSEGKLDDGFDFLNAEAWTRLPAGTVVELIQD